MKREDFEEYLKYFNEKQYDEAAAYFADDVCVMYPNEFLIGDYSENSLTGKARLFDMYRTRHESIEEARELDDFAVAEDGKSVFVILHTEYRAKEDTIWSAGFMKKGVVAVAINVAAYTLDDAGKFEEVRIALHDFDCPGTKIRHLL